MKKLINYTAGHWSCGVAPEERTPTYLIGADGVIFCRIVGRSHEEAISNAKLIRAAPELFEALIELLAEKNPDSIKKAREIIGLLEEKDGGM